MFGKFLKAVTWRTWKQIKKIILELSHRNGNQQNTICLGKTPSFFAVGLLRISWRRTADNCDFFPKWSVFCWC